MKKSYSESYQHTDGNNNQKNAHYYSINAKKTNIKNESPIIKKFFKDNLEYCKKNATESSIIATDNLINSINEFINSEKTKFGKTIKLCTLQQEIQNIKVIINKKIDNQKESNNFNIIGDIFVNDANFANINIENNHVNDSYTLKMSSGFIILHDKEFDKSMLEFSKEMDEFSKEMDQMFSGITIPKTPTMRISSSKLMLNDTESEKVCSKMAKSIQK